MALTPDLVRPLTGSAHREMQVIEADDRYPPDSEPSMSEHAYHRHACQYAAGALENIFSQADSRPFIGANMDMYWEELAPDRKLAPDVLLAFGVVLKPGASYQFWQAGRSPDLVMEMISPSTWEKDCIEKMRQYAELGIREYWQYDPQGACDPRQARMPAPLQGWCLLEGAVPADNRYEPIDGQDKPWGTAYESEVLGTAWCLLHPDIAESRAAAFSDLPDADRTLRLRLHDPAGGFVQTQGEKDAENRTLKAENREKDAENRALKAEIARLRQQLAE